VNDYIGGLVHIQVERFIDKSHHRKGHIYVSGGITLASFIENNYTVKLLIQL